MLLLQSKIKITDVATKLIPVLLLTYRGLFGSQ